MLISVKSSAMGATQVKLTLQVWPTIFVWSDAESPERLPTLFDLTWHPSDSRNLNWYEIYHGYI